MVRDILPRNAQREMNSMGIAAFNIAVIEYLIHSMTLIET
jgi:hypothetical protein